MASRSERSARNRKKQGGEGARPYQLDLLDAAIDANTIVALGTGAGKTFIAVMLIKEYSHEVVGSYNRDGAKRTFFLVPTVPLVKQQAQYIRQHTHLAVKEFTGDMNVDSWEQNRWNDAFENCNILVMTKQILLNLLQRRFIALKNINLLILDECHHAVKKDGYVEIMMIFDSFQKQDWPRVLGLSASILPSKCKPGQLEKSIRALEETLHSRAQTAGDLAEVSRYAATPEIKYLDYRASECDQQLSLKCTIKEPLDFLAKFRQDDMKSRTYKVVKNHLDDCVHILDNLGLWCAHLFAETAVEELKETKMKNDDSSWDKALLHLAVTHLRIFEQESRGLLLPYGNRTPVTRKVERLLLELGDSAVVRGIFSDGDTVCSSASEGGGGGGGGVASEEGSEDSPNSNAVNGGGGGVASRSRPSRRLHGIVFVERRTTAKLLAEVIKRRSTEDPDLRHIRCDYLVGHSAGLTSGDTYLRKEARMSHNKQNQMLQLFRSEKINLLIATSVVEEGLDVPKCNMVCRFDLPPNFRSYIQSKGRARAKGSVFYLLVDEAHAAAQKDMIRDYCLLEEELNVLCHERTVPDEEEEEAEMECLAPPYEPFGKESDIRATLSSSRSMIHKYCQKLPADRYTSPSPIFISVECKSGSRNTLTGAHKDPWFTCYLRLPFNSPISNRIIKGPAMPTKQWAEKAAALEAISVLHKAKELDHDLKPVPRGAMDDGGDESDGEERTIKDAGTQKRSQIYKKETAACLIGSVPKAGVSSFLYVFVLQETVAGGGQYYQSTAGSEGPHPTFGLLSSKPIPHSRLPPFPLYVREKELSVSIHRHSTEVLFSAEELDVLCRCHDALFTEILQFPLQSSTVGGATGEGGKDYLCVPVGFMEPTVAYVDLEMAKTIAGLSKARVVPVSWPCPMESLRGDRLLGVCHRDSSRPQGKGLELYRVLRVDPSITPASEFPQYSTSYASYFKTKYNYDLTDLSQPALVCVPVGTQNLQLTTSRYKAADGRDLDKKATPNTETLFFPQHCKVYQLPAHMLHLAMCLPSLLWRIESLLLVEELRVQIAHDTKVGIDGSGHELTVSTVLHGYRDEGCYATDVRCYNLADGTYREVPSSFSASARPQNTGPDCALLLQGLTPRGANDILNLERLETLGDAFLKLVSAMSVLCSKEHSQTWGLTRARSKYVTNLHLYTLAKKKGLTGKIQTGFRPRETWLPPRLLPPQTAQEKLYSYHEVTDKGVADCVEALAGAYLVAGGLDASLSFLSWLGFLEPIVPSGQPDDLTVTPPNPTCNFNPSHVLIRDSRSALCSYFGPTPFKATFRSTETDCTYVPVDGLGTRVHVENLAAMLSRCTGTSGGSPRVLGWTFRDPKLFVQAFTHSSYARNWITDWYKRLEFLGDAVLDYLVTSHIYLTKRLFKPGEISGLRAALVNNVSFAQAVVKERLHTHLLHSSPTLFTHLQQYISAMETVPDGDGEEEDGHNVDPSGDCEPEDMKLDPPKVLGDLFESVAGAIFIDSGMDLEAVWGVFIKVLEDKIEGYKDKIPVTPLQQLFEMEPTVQLKIKGSKCTITVEEKGISETASAHSAQASKQMAARKVIARLHAACTIGT